MISFNNGDDGNINYDNHRDTSGGCGDSGDRGDGDNGDI